MQHGFGKIYSKSNEKEYWLMENGQPTYQISRIRDSQKKVTDIFKNCFTHKDSLTKLFPDEEFSRKLTLTNTTFSA